MSTRTTATRKSERLEARIPAPQKEVLLRAASLQGQSLTEFVLSSAAEAAKRIIRENDLLELSERDQLAFAQALVNPPKASARLKKAAKDYGADS